MVFKSTFDCGASITEGGGVWRSGEGGAGTERRAGEEGRRHGKNCDVSITATRADGLNSKAVGKKMPRLLQPWS